MTPDRVKRKLTTILTTDVKGYSRLMGEDEEWTLRTLNNYKGVIGNLVGEHRGRVVASLGEECVAIIRLSLLLVAVLSFVPMAHGGQIFLDNYEGIATGTDLTGIMRTPTVGPNNSAGWISATGSAKATVVAAFDGMAASVVVPEGGTFDYLAYLNAGADGRLCWSLLTC